MPLLPSARLDGVWSPDRDGEGGHPESEKDAKSAQKLYQLQPFVVVFLQEANDGPICVFWAAILYILLAILRTKYTGWRQNDFNVHA